MAKASLAFLRLLALTLFIGCSGNMAPTVHAGTSTLKQQLEAGGNVDLGAGIITVSCADEAVITKSTHIRGAGRNDTILQDNCSSGAPTIGVDLTHPITVAIEDLQINHVGGPDVKLSGGASNPGAVLADYVPMLDHELRLMSLKLTGTSSDACLVTDGLNLLFVEHTIIARCSHDGAQIGSFGVNLHDNWFAQNGHNGVTFVGGGFCGSCTGNEYFFNAANGLEYANTATADPRHVGDFADSNGGFGVMVNGVRDFAFNAGWIGNNQAGGASIGNTGILGTSLVGTTFANDFATDLTVTTKTGPLRTTGTYSAFPQYTGCNALIAGSCADLNQP